MVPRSEKSLSRRTAFLVAVFALGAGVTGCAEPAAVACASWPLLTSAEMADIADLVLTTDSIERSGVEEFLGVDAAAYEVVVREVTAGDADPGAVIRVVSTPDSCAANYYAEGDQLATSGLVRLYLTVEEDGLVRTLTPFAGVERLTGG